MKQHPAGGGAVMGERSWREATVVDVLDRAVAANPDGEAVVCGPVRLTYRELAAEVERLAMGLADLGVRRGDRVALWLVNRPEWVITYFAVAKLGAVLVAVNTRYRAAECRHILRTSGASVVILQDQFHSQRYLDVVEALCPGLVGADPGEWRSEELPALREVVVLGEDQPRGGRSFAALVQRGGEALASGRVPVGGAEGPDDPFLVLFTSGTTSRSKGVVLTHRNIVANSQVSGERQRLESRDRMLIVLPLSSAFSCAHALLATMTHHATLVLLDAFAATSCMRLVEAERCTAMFAVDAIFQDLLDAPDRAEFDLGSLRTGVGVLTAEVAERIRRDLGVVEYQQGWGMTELGGVTTVTACDDPDWARLRTVGRPVPGLDVGIVDPVTGEVAGEGVVGEIVVRGFAVTQGYFTEHGVDSGSTDESGWFHTGDLGEVLPGGFLRYRGRIKEMLKPGGFNVAPLEIEEFLCSLPGIRAAAVVGVPDRRMTEAVAAFVVREPGASDDDLTAEEIRRRCADQLANYKVPRHVTVLSPDLPRNDLGKVLKHQLRERAMRELAGADDPVPSPSTPRG